MKTLWKKTLLLTCALALLLACAACDAITPGAAATPTAPRPVVSASFTPAPTPTPIPTPTPDQGDFGAAFAEKFAQGDEIVSDEAVYRSKDVSVELIKVHETDLTYYVADIYVRNIENLRTAFSRGRFGAKSEATLDQAKNNKAIAAISGDYCTFQGKGVIIRNGELYRKTDSATDLCVIYKDGTMKTYSPGEIDYQQAMADGAWQSWAFGPMLLTDGQAMSDFNTRVARKNPRSAIGYYAPGHYCFVLVDGRQGSYSKGMSMEELSNLFYKLGCKEAYNLDGGKTSVMTFGSGLANQPYDGGRGVSDIIYVAEVAEDEGKE